MQNVDRNDQPAPACLSDERTLDFRNALLDIFREDISAISQKRIYMRQYMVAAPELDAALVSLFRQRCAFCESNDENLKAYRFRPTEEAGPSEAAPRDDADRSHLYYSWLVNAWRNIYPICSGCLPSEISVFPVQTRRCHLPSQELIERYAEKPVGDWAGAINERPYFLDPCGNEDFRRNLAALPNGELVGLSSRGGATIRHFQLNRPELVARRAHAFHFQLAALLSGARDHENTADSFDFERMEFGGGWFLLLFQMARKLGGGGGGRPTLSRKRIGQYYSERLQSPEFADSVEAAFHNLLEQPEQLTNKQAAPIAPVRGDARPTAFSISNFKGLEAIKVELKASPKSDFSDLGSQMPSSTPALVILGENAAGKSSILEAMALALADQPTRDDLSLYAAAYMLDPAMMGSPLGKRRPGLVEVTYDDGTSSAMEVGPGFPFVRGAEIPRIPVFAFGAFRLFLKADKRARRSSPIRSLFEANYVLPNPEKWLASLHGKPLFAEVARALKDILAIDQEVDVIEVDALSGECSLLVTRVRLGAPPLTIRTPFRAVSSGFRAILAMVCDVMRGLIAAQGKLSASLANARAVVLIDEIEVHLHPKWKMRIIHGLRKALPNVTFIVTTHDPLCLRGLNADDIRVFRRFETAPSPEPAQLPTRVEQLLELPAIGALTIEQLLTSDLFDLYSTEAPEMEVDFAKAGDLLARAHAGHTDDADAESLAAVRAMLRVQIGDSIPIGSTWSRR